ncbi:MAG: epimerase [Bacteroidetes bacterium]|nr:epimerase [Bacteroidota bacterium]
MSAKIRTIIAGTTGMVGEGVLHECLQNDAVEAVLIINRKPSGVTHPKLKEIIHSDFFDISPIENQLVGYNACYFCLGVSSIGMKEDAYTKLTYTLTMGFGETLSKINPEMTFCYVSGVATDSTEKGRSMWARVKGKTENDLMKLPFGKVFCFRPGFIKPIKGLKNTHKFYAYINWMFPIGRALFPGAFCTLQEMGKAMINTANISEKRKILEGKDIIALGK